MSWEEEKRAERRKAIEESLGNPVLADVPDELRKTKRNLLVVAGVVIFASLAEIEVTQAGFLGFQFTNPSEWWLDLSLLCVVAYLFAQFAWQVADYLMQTRVRITGTRVAHVTTARAAGSEGDYPNDPSQSSLYYWWSEETKSSKGLHKTVAELEGAAERIDAFANQPENAANPNINHVESAAHDLRRATGELQRQIEQWEKVITSQRIPLSLERFDRWFGCFTRSQVWRLFVLDIALPSLVAGLAFYCLLVPDAPAQLGALLGTRE